MTICCSHKLKTFGTTIPDQAPKPEHLSLEGSEATLATKEFSV